MRSSRTVRNAQIGLTAFLGTTSVAGAIALLTALNSPPVELLRESPFENYLVPGLVLLIPVGGAALLAMLLCLLRHRRAPLACAVAGAMIIGFEVVQVVLIGSPPGVPRGLQTFYTLLGLTIFALAIVQRPPPALHRARP